MNKNLTIILAILFIPLIAYFVLSKNNNTSIVEAKVHQPQMLKFTSRMCYDCQRLEDVVKNVYPQYADKVVLTEVSVQDNSSSVQTMIKKYQVKLVPTSIFLDKDGNIKNRVEGYIDNEKLSNYLSEISNNG